MSTSLELISEPGLPVAEPVLIPHPNELNKLSRFQKKLCAALCLAPALPLYVRFSDTSAIAAGSIRACTILAPVYVPADGAVSCSAQVTLSAAQGETMLTGTLTLARLFSAENGRQENAVSIQNALETLVSGEGAGLFPLRLPVFRAAQVAVTESHNAVHWEVRTERWIKAQRAPDALSAREASSAGKN